MIDVNHPFYRPLWRRLLIIAVSLSWLGFEVFISHDGFWTIIAGAFAALSLWFLLITWKDPPPDSAV